MSAIFTQQGTIAATAIVTLDPDRSGNFWCTGAADEIEINAAQAYLTLLGGTEKKKLVLKGDFSTEDVVTLDSYMIVELQGRITLAADSDVNTIYALSETEIEFYGGHVDGNGDNQGAATDINTFFFDSCSLVNIHNVLMGGSHRNTTNGETLLLTNCTLCDIHDNDFYLYATVSYDHIKLRGASCQYNNIHDNNLDGTDGLATSNAIQLSTSANLNVIQNNTIYSPDTAASGIKLHTASNNFILGNTITEGGSEGIGLIDDCDFNYIFGNYIFEVRYALRIRGSSGTASENTFENNWIYLSDAHADAIGIQLDNAPDETNLLRNIIIGNSGFGADTGIDIVDGTSAHLRGNTIKDCSTVCTDAGTDTDYDAVSFPFTYPKGGSAWVSAGIEVDAGGESAVAQYVLPPVCQSVMRISVMARTDLADADGMLVDWYLIGAQANEPEATELIQVNSNVSITTNFAANDIIWWRITPSDDADVDDLTALDSGYCEMIHRAAAVPNDETSARFKCVMFEYV